MLNIVCVNAGDYLGQGATYVNRLYDMCIRNLAEGYRGQFIVFTDCPDGYDEGVVVKPLPHPGLKGWFNKIALFKPGLFEPTDRVLYFDLDTLITGRLDEIASYDGDFAILADFFKPTTGPFSGLQSGVMGWRGGFGAEIWEAFEAAGFPDVPGGDQAFIRSVCPSPDLWQSMFPGLFVSYKGTGGAIPDKASVVCFHGIPRPHEVLTGWVPQVWRIGGLSRADLDVLCNTAVSKLLENVESACKRDLPWLDICPMPEEGGVCIVGGGPSLTESIPVLKRFREAGAEIWALNGAHDYLIKNGIVPNAMVMLDARPENVEFVREPHPDVLYLIASQCAPAVFDALDGFDVCVWHANSPYVYQLLESMATTKPRHLFGGGTSVGCMAISLASQSGFRGIHCYGMDSSYRDDRGHAYPQSLNDGERILDVVAGDKKFPAAAWMVQQVNDFQVLAADLANRGYVISVGGDGLLAEVARQMMAPPPGPVRKVGELEWPGHDSACRAAVMLHGDMDVSHALEMTVGRECVVQAGGNVGAYPIALAEHFERVITFEPDPENWACLERNIATSRRHNIEPHNAALGNTRRGVSLSKIFGNCGATFVDGDGDIPVMRIDDLRLSACDLIWLDIEGQEFEALKGAENTIGRFHPVVRIEHGSTQLRLGVDLEPILEWLSKRGYMPTSECGKDITFTYQPASARAAAELLSTALGA